MQTVAPKYAGVVMPIRSVGVASLRIPFHDWVRQYERLFAARAISRLADGRTASRSQIAMLLDDAQLTADAATLDEWSRGRQLPSPSWDDTLKGLAKLAAKGRDLAAEAGTWRNDAFELRASCAEAVDEIVRRATAAIRAARRSHGIAAAQKLIAEWRCQLEEVRHALLAETTEWSGADREVLDKVILRLSRLSVPRSSWGKLRLKYSPRLQAARILSFREVKEIQRLVEVIGSAFQKRSQLSLRRAKLDALNDLLGQEDRPGRLQALVAKLQQERLFYERLSSLLESERDVLVGRSISAGTDITLLGDLQSPICPSGITVADLFDERASRADWTAGRLADTLQTEGITLNGEIVLPLDWPRCAAGDIAQAVLAAARHALGSDRPDIALDLVEPHSVIEHCASLDLTAPELRGLVLERSRDLVARSAPYCSCPVVGTRRPNTQAFLYCHPSQCHFWQATLDDLRFGDEGQNATLATGHPFVVVVQQVLLAGSLGANPQWQRWIAEANRAVGHTKIEPLKNRRNFIDIRLLRERVRDHDDCEQLLAAAIKGRLVHEVGSPPTGWTISQPDPRATHHFAPRTFGALWQPSETFHALLRSEPTFVAFVQQLFPALTDFSSVAVQLAHAHQPHDVAESLTTLGVLESRTGQYRMARTPLSVLSHMPRCLYRSEFGKLVGLSRDEFESRLLSDDDLYNVLFWRVLDTFQLCELTVNDVPDSILHIDQLLT